MFNHEIKEKFINDYTTSISMQRACVTLFNVFEPYEKEWGADLCTQSADVLQPIVNGTVGIRANSKKLRLSILREYVKWCIKNGVPGAQEGMFSVEVDGTEKMRQQTVANPLHLQMYLNQIFEPESEKTVENTYRCYYWLAYAGMQEEDILNVKTSDVDFSNMIVRFGDKEYPIYREAIPAFKNCVTLSQFIYKHPNYALDKVSYRDRADGDQLLRGFRACPSITAMRVELSRRSRWSIEEHKTTMRLSYFRLWISGLFYRMYEMEKAGVPVDFSDVAAQFVEGRTYKSGSKPYKKIAMGYLVDYERWKATFN